ncbi:MAG: DUF1330 domain-containing protein [Desulfarculaceae bacterium]|nr:DUF1330 domain-containing protein [Desulfarculaceae bacterium]MCF8073860.1 DUF1330 domain-containing protein [Desulfarculaceae bacterium]MCF8102840.1 DUF1330 domain-containing protein [Desulfarculaceae bacterium]MCF8116284.1 DUF1330 domain-containing protein [Desulfarculaceae bacterium]
MNHGQPFLMLNALWFKPEGGRESYRRYMKLAGPVLAKHGGRLVAGGTPRQAIIGEFDANLVFFVEYPSWRAFQDMLADPDYRQALPHREAAITKSLLIRCEKTL